jgi:adenylate kinase family enzyme
MLDATQVELLRRANRILVIGSPGSGKSTLSQKLAPLLSLPYIAMDRAFFWKPGWDMRERAEIRALIAEAVAGEKWLMDGTGANSLDLRLPRADLIVWLERSRLLCLFRVLKRWLQFRGKSRPDMPEDCPERVNAEFLRYVWNFQRDVSPVIRRKIAQYGPYVPVLTLRCDAEIETLLARLETAV